jgi:hypothetical protein
MGRWGFPQRSGNLREFHGHKGLQCWYIGSTRQLVAVMYEAVKESKPGHALRCGPETSAPSSCGVGNSNRSVGLQLS